MPVTGLLKIVFLIFRAHKLVCKRPVVLIILGARAQVLIQQLFQIQLQIRWLPQPIRLLLQIKEMAVLLPQQR